MVLLFDRRLPISRYIMLGILVLLSVVTTVLIPQRFLEKEVVAMVFILFSTIGVSFLCRLLLLLLLWLLFLRAVNFFLTHNNHLL
jgi:hypothetical protein